MKILILIMLIASNLGGTLKQTIDQKLKYFQAVGYKPGEIQLQGHSAKKKFVAIRGGNRSGKTVFAGMECAASVQVPLQSIWNVGPTYDLANKVFRITYNLGVRPLKWPLLIDRQNPPEFQTAILTHVWAKSTEKLKSLEGEGVNKMTCDEFGYYTKQMWERLVVRLDQENSQCFVIFTPKGKNIWTREFWAEKEKDPEWLTLVMPTDEVEYASKEFLEIAERELGGKDSPAYKEQIRGEFVTYGILVYPMWTQKNISEKFTVNKRSGFFIGADKGFIHPCAATYWEVTKGDRCHQLDEYYKKYTTDQKNAIAIIEKACQLSKDYNFRTSKWRAFYSPEEPGFGTELRTAGKKYGIKVYKANNEVDPGLELIRILLPTQILVHRRCHYTIWETHNYSYKKDSETINKIHDDCWDANRYALLAAFGGVKGKVKKVLY